jgi:hypothetical protein
MNRTSTLVTVAASVLAATALFATVTHGKDAPVAQNTTTVWVNGKGQAGFSEKVNAVHAEMEAKGWKFADLEIYTEDGDMQGAFVTYVR